MYQTLFQLGEFGIRLIDIVDFGLLVSILFVLYRILKGSLAFTIFLGIALLFILFLIVKKLDMHLMTQFLGQFMSIGVMALLILFQQEVRKFLQVVGRNILMSNRFSLIKYFPWNWNRRKRDSKMLNVIIDSCFNMSRSRTGALIVFSGTSELRYASYGGVFLDAQIAPFLLESIFNKNAPMHDGAVIIANNRIKAAGCVLPIADDPNIPLTYGMRHRAAIGITEQSDAVALVVSEETGKIALVKQGEIHYFLNKIELVKELLQVDTEIN